MIGFTNENLIVNFAVWVSVFYIVNRINGKQMWCRKVYESVFTNLFGGKYE